MKRKYICYLILVIFTLTSCNKFMDILPSTQTVNPVTIKDFQEMLNSDSLSNANLFLLDLMSDDVQLTDAALASADNKYSRSYLWKKTIWNAGDYDEIYYHSYKLILQMNIILSRIDIVPASDTLNTFANRELVRSQALLNRAKNYLLLANTYGLAYKATATTDLAVPIITNPDATDLPSRSTVAEVYTLILSDIKKALSTNVLPDLGADIIHPGKAAAFALLSRTYLYKSDYDSALAFADSALLIKSTLQNYNTVSTGVTPTQLYDVSKNTETIWGNVSNDAGFYTTFLTTLLPSKALVDSLGGTWAKYADRRYALRLSSSYYPVSQLSDGNTGYCMDNSFSVPELYLTKAECLARNGNVTDATKIITLLRQNRCPSYSVSNGTYSTATILNKVLGERRRELFLHGGLRLFDLKRLNVQTSTSIDITRISNITAATLATLTANSPNYLLPFSPTVLANNSKIVQNERN